MNLQGLCYTYGNVHTSLEDAKISCSKDGKCAGVTSKFSKSEFELCYSISIVDDALNYDVYKKASFKGYATI